MKIKDLERTANIAWSPAKHYPILLAAGTAAQQLDASFNTNASLELYSLNLSEEGMDMELKASISNEYRFHKVAWGSHSTDESGVIVGGCEGGLVQIYSVSKLMSGENSLICQQNKHTGSVRSLDFNPFQQNLLATGASESEIYIWDLNNTSTPMTPGSKSQPLEDVQYLSWNRKVQHILATTFCTRCMVWDLRKNEQIIKLTDTSTHIRWKVVAWHPEVATQLCLASDDDQSPVVQLWDLRFATSPLKVLENHQKGVLSIAWCDQDSDLLISCGKDNKILCWNPNSNALRGEVLSEIAHTGQWNFDISWCPRNPALIAASNYDGHVSIYSLMGGKQEQVQTSNKIADSFPGMDGYIQAPAPQQAPAVSVDLTKAPKWLKKPAGASFGFGGKLVTFENIKPVGPGQAGQPTPVNISQVITEPELVKKSHDLEQALQSGQFSDYCRLKAESALSHHVQYVWSFMKANFEKNSKDQLLSLLGYNSEEIAHKLDCYANNDKLTDQTSSLNSSSPIANLQQASTFDAIATETSKAIKQYKINTGDDTDGLIAQALLLGNIQAAVELCMRSDRMADALIIAMTGGSELLARTQYRYLQSSQGYVSSLISALVSEDWLSVVNQCQPESWKEALVGILSHASLEEMPYLCERLGERLEVENNGNEKLAKDAQLCYICAGSFDKLVASWSKHVSTSDPNKLQELVELVMFMQKAVEQQGRIIEVSGKLAELLSHYAGLLASQGNLNTALGYLGQNQQDHLTELRDRLSTALGYGSMYTAKTQQHRLSTSRASFNQPLVPPKTYSPVPPPRPTSVGSTHGTIVGGRTKYVLDPSVKSNNYGVGSMHSAYNNPMVGLASPPVPTQFIPQVIQPLTQSTQPLIPQPIQSQSQVQQPNVEVAQPAFPSMSMAPPGWNDPPPVMSKNPKVQQQKLDYTLQTPITHPIFGAAPETVPMNNGYGEPPQVPFNQNLPMQSYEQQPLSVPQQVNRFHPPTQNYQMVGMQQSMQFQQQQQQQHPQQSATMEPPKPKGPVPEEHMYLQTVFDELRTQCSCKANNPQTKRKIDDVARKLETLYDMLREHKLSPNTLSGLHQMVQMIQKADYTGGLNLHTQLVSGTDFAQIASFMPGIKVLLQCALQLQVYLR